MQARNFVNFYETLDVAANASTAAIERKFRQLARRFHPDNQTTGDRASFDAVVEAHETLKNPGRRAQYHEEFDRQLPPLTEPAGEDAGGAEIDAEEEPEAFADNLGIERDISIQNNVLMLLYFQRRRNIREPGIGNGELERLSGCPAEQLEFHLWYLKAKGWIARGDDGLLAITIDGVDRAAAIHRESANRLITDQS